MKKTLYLFLFLFSFSNFLMAQCGGTILTVDNPSFEGTPEPHVTPPDWDICMPGNTPDTQPGSWGITLPPYDGTSYIGLVWGGSSWVEGASQTLSSPMVAGTTYEFTIAIATTASTDGGIDPGCVELQIWGNMGGNSGCDHSELLWSSGDVFDAPHMDQWVLHNVSFTPSQNWGHMLFSINTLNCSTQPYIMLDALSPIVPIADIAEYDWTVTGISSDVCAGQVVSFHDSSSSVQGTIVNWAWDFGDGVTSTAQNPTHTFANPGTYDVSLTVVSSVPCTTNVVHQVVVYETPTVTVSGGGSICPGGASSVPVVFTFSGASPWNLSYTDGTTPVTVNGINSTPYTINASTTGVYSATSITNDHCTGTASGSATVVFNNLPNVTFAPLTSVCYEFPEFQLMGGSPAGGTYSGDGVNGNMFNPAVAGVGTHTLTYTYTDPLTTCTNSATQTITVNSSIVIGVNPSVIYLCPGASAVLVATGASTYNWNPPDGLDQSVGSAVLATPEASTIYTVVGTNNVGCTGSNLIYVNIYNTSLVDIISDPPEGCQPLHVMMTYQPELQVEDSTWHWNFGDNNSVGNISHDKNPEHIFESEGNYMVVFNAIDTSGCPITDTLIIPVFVLPTAAFYNNPDVGYAGVTDMYFIDMSVGAYSWLWDFGDPSSYNYNTSDLQNPTHLYADSGTYTVQLIVTSTRNCSDTATKDVVIFPDFLIFIPTAFTPNNDNLNDMFKPVITGFDRSQYKFYIFDRWGREIFYSEDIDKGWDGKDKGKYVEAGVYSYLIYFAEYTGKEHKVKGSFTLVR